MSRQLTIDCPEGSPAFHARVEAAITDMRAWINSKKEELENAAALAQAPSTKTSFLSLPKELAERICYPLGTKDRQALSMSCTFFSAHFHQSYRRRCRLLLAADAEAQLFGRFGIVCPGDQAPTHAQVGAMVSRVHSILKATNEGLENFPEIPRPAYPAEALVMRVKPKHLRGVLETAYKCTMYKVFEHCDPLRLPFAPSLEAAVQRIRAWLDSPGALEAVAVRAVFRNQVGEETLLTVGSTVEYHMAWATRRSQSLSFAQAAATHALQGADGELQAPETTGRPTTARRSDYTAPLSCFPDELGRLPNLLSLDLSGEDRVVVLPSTLGQLTNLQKLTVLAPDLCRLPAELGHLQKLEQLSVTSHTALTIPQEVWQPKALKDLSLSAGLLELPPEIWQLDKLEALRVRGTRLEKLPPEIGQLKRLKFLSLAYNQLKSVSRELGRLKNLWFLDLSHNQLQSVPRALGRLTNLIQFNLQGNPLRSLPPAVQKLVPKVFDSGDEESGASDYSSTSSEDESDAAAL